MAYQHWQTWVKIAFVPTLLLATTVADFTTECQRPCDCRWQSGNKAAICSNASLKAIPTNLSSDIQILDLSNNNLLQLHQEGFRKVGLSNLKKLFLKDCNIEIVHKATFATLAIMIELDLSKNRIRYLHPDTFKGTEKLRLINLSNNFIDKLEDGLFRNLKFLQKVELSNNMIARIGTKTFVNLPQLRILRFDGNNLNHMKPETLMSLRNLSSLDLHNNPWRCDCNLQTFRDWVISHNLYTPPTSCAEPLPIREKLWNELDSTNFACRPTILEPLPDSTVKSFDENVTLTCKVVGNPGPDVVWRFNGKTIELKSFGEIKHFITDNTIDLIRWVNLTIVNARYTDRGNYTCVAENPGGRDEKTLFLILSRYGYGTIAGMDTDMFAVLVGCLTAIVIILGAVMTMCYFSTQNAELKRLIKNESRTSNGDALIEGSTNSEPEKILKSEVNPVMKPPRKYDPPASLTSEATEMSELNRTLLDDESILAASSDEQMRPHEVKLPKVSQETILVDRLAQDHQAYPPDLLSFPLRVGPKVSPGNLKDTQSRLSPEKSPGYIVTSINPAMYSRYQSPTSFESNIPLVTSKGYITLPRKPKTQERRDMSNMSMNSYYDNFNMKIFNHSNYHTLNKSELGLGSSGKIDYHDSDEIEPAPSPAPGTPHATIPRNSISSPNIHNQLLSHQTMSVNSHGKYYRSEHRPLKVALGSSDDYIINSIKDLRINYGINVISGNSKRTAPKPPPKPKKNNTSELIEPFLMNASENATQV